MIKLKNIFFKIDRICSSQKEEQKMVEFVKALHLDEKMRILDVGCGYGRNMKLLTDETRAKIEGIDINEHLISEDRKNGLNCYTLEEFQQRASHQYDCIIFSHIIEHFMPNDLKKFLEGYLQYLKIGGYIIIATPLLWKGFFWDFDHIKTYHPVGIDMVFGGHDAQVQYYADTKLELKDIWFRRESYMVHYKRGLFVKDKFSRLWMLLNLVYKFLYKVSFGYVGQTNGWMGLYRKVDKKNVK